MAVLIKPDGTKENVYPSDKEKGFSLEELYKMIGCDCIEILSIYTGLYMIVDDEARLKPNQKVNDIASNLFLNGTVILGNVVICNNSEIR